MMHKKTFEAINKLKDVEVELHRLKNALEMANKALDAQRPWVELEGEEIRNLWEEATKPDRSTVTMVTSFARAIEAKLKEKNT